VSDVVATDAVVTLRRWREDDADAITAACQDPEISHWIPMIPRPYRREHALSYVRGEVEGLGEHQYAIEVDGAVAGAIGMTVNRMRAGHIGYWCAAEARGRGVVTRALRLLSLYGFEELGLQRLELITDPDNVASQRVAEKVGYRREGVLRSHLDHPDGRRRDSVMFSLLPGEVAT
jgi:[ribosomal protein S5]-alanine N-acetyltransferase